jgi:hypothetical protein
MFPATEWRSLPAESLDRADEREVRAQFVWIWPLLTLQRCARSARAEKNPLNDCDRSHGKAAHPRIEDEMTAPSATAKRSTGFPGL